MPKSTLVIVMYFYCAFKDRVALIFIKLETARMRNVCLYENVLNYFAVDGVKVLVLSIHYGIRFFSLR